MVFKEFLDMSKAVDSTLTRHKVADLSFSIVEEDVQVKSGGKLFGVLTDRALRNLSRISTASPRLLLNQQDSILNTLVKTQLAGMDELQMLKDPTNETRIASIFPGSKVYIPYSDLLEPVANKVFSIKGNPVDDDSMTFLVKSRSLDLGGDIIVGPHFTISSNSLVRSRFSFGGYRVICSNGFIDNVFRCNYLDSIDVNVVRAMVRDSFDNEGEYEKVLTEVHNFMVNEPLDINKHWYFLETMPLSKAVVDKYKAIVKDPLAFGEELDGAKVSGVATIWESFNLLTHLVKDIEAPGSRNRAEAAIYKWVTILKRV